LILASGKAQTNRQLLKFDGMQLLSSSDNTVTEILLAAIVVAHLHFSGEYSEISEPPYKMDRKDINGFS